MERIKIKLKMILFFSFSIALGAIAGFVHSSSSLIEASAPSTSGTSIAPTAPPESEKKTEQSPAATTSQENGSQVAQDSEVPKKTNTIESDQTLWEFAQTNGVSIQDLMNQNQMTSTVVVEGQELIVEK